MKNPVNKTYNYILFVFCFLSGAFGGLTSTLVPSYLPVLSKSFSGENVQQMAALINASFIYGMLAGGIVIGYCSDKFGRKFGVQFSTFCIGLFTLFTSFAPGWTSLIVFRFLTGFGVGGVLLSTTILISEIWPIQKKVIALGILSICFPVGIFSAGVITYFITDWRSAFLVGIFPLVIMALNQFFIKEPEVWLKERKDTKEKEALPLTKTILTNLVIGSLIYGTMLIGLWAVFAWLPTWVQSFAENSNGQKERGISMMLFAFGGLVGGFSSGWLSKLLGTRSILLLCFAGTFLLSVFLFKFTTSVTLVTYISMVLIAVFFGVSQGVLNSYIPELFPTAYRSTGTGICFNVSRIFTATAVFFIGWLVHVLSGFGNALFCFSFVFLLGFIITLVVRDKKETL